MIYNIPVIVSKMEYSSHWFLKFANVNLFQGKYSYFSGYKGDEIETFLNIFLFVSEYSV